MELLPGARARALLCRPELLIVEWEFQPGTVVPEHSHDELQVTICSKGTVELMVEGKTHTLAAGESIVIKPGERHAARFPAEARVVDVFVPPRRQLQESLCS